MKAIIPYKLTKKEREAIAREIDLQTAENVKKLSVNLQAMVLWCVRQQYGSGKKKLLDFQKAFLPMIKELQDFYQAENAAETEFILLHRLKNEVGIDVEELGEMFEFEVKVKE